MSHRFVRLRCWNSADLFIVTRIYPAEMNKERSFPVVKCNRLRFRALC